MIKPAAYALLFVLSLCAPAHALDQAVKNTPASDQWNTQEKKPSMGNLPPEFFTADSNTVIAKLIKAYGGHSAIAASETFFANGRVFDIADEQYYTQMYYLAPMGKLRIDTIVSGRTDVQILNGWRSFRGIEGLSRYTLAGMELKELEFEHLSMTLPLFLSRGSYKATYLGTASLNGRLVYSLMIESEKSPFLGLYVDVKTGLILKVTARLEHNGEFLSVERHFRAYQPLNNTKRPRKILNLRDGVLIERVEIFRYDTGTLMSNSLFE